MKRVEESFGLNGVAAAFLGGTEKLKEGIDYGVPLVKAEDPVSAVDKALEEYATSRSSWTSRTSRWWGTGRGCG
jgi:hypothetical protein